MGEWTDCWPPNLPPKTRVRANVKIPLDRLAQSCWITVEDTAEAFTQFMAPPAIGHRYDSFGDLGLTRSEDQPFRATAPVGGTWSGSGGSTDFTVSN